MLTEIDEKEYQFCIGRSQLIQKVKSIFYQYQQDWLTQGFEQMTDYLDKDFQSKQEKIFRENFGQNFDIVYHPELLEAAPIKFEQVEENYIFCLQINAKMINFELSPDGYVMSGEPDYRYFTEYWQFKIDSLNKCYLSKILQFPALTS